MVPIDDAFLFSELPRVILWLYGLHVDESAVARGVTLGALLSSPAPTRNRRSSHRQQSHFEIAGRPPAAGRPGLIGRLRSPYPQR